MVGCGLLAVVAFTRNGSDVAMAGQAALRDLDEVVD